MTISNPFDLILSEIEELKTEVRKIRVPGPPEKQSENITIDQAIQLLIDNGYPTTKAQVYKLSHLGEIPASRIGKRLVFSRKALLNWIESRKIAKVSPQRMAAEKLASLVRNRERSRI
jgi:hypothetical protein